MPKLIYFPVQGRAQAIRYMLGAKGVAFEDQMITGAEWGPMKEAKTYGDAQMPIYVADDGSYYNQSVAILKMLAMDHGYSPSTPKCLFEVEWMYGVVVDIIEKPERYALMKDDAEEPARQACIDLLSKFMDKLDERFADGRAHVGGDQITDGDFSLLALVTSHYENAGGKHADIKAATAAKLQSCANVMRVVAPMRELCAAQIAALVVSSI